MAYTEKEARTLIIQAGLELVKNELVARTWGNISAKISDTEFIITPSGLAYENLTEDDLVKVKIEDCSYSGDIKPSSEKGIHADCYKIRKDINFIIHTHQNYATAISIDKEENTFAPIAKYGLPSTKGLRKNVIKAVINNPAINNFLLARHGAICLGKDYEQAFNNAYELETQAKAYYLQFVKADFKLDEKLGCKPYLDDYAQMFGYKKDQPLEDDLKAIELIKHKNALAASFAFNKKQIKPMCCFDVLLQNFVYKNKYSKKKYSK